MANKKIIMSVTASAVIASTFVAAEEASAESYKVKSGDSLWAIAQKYNTSVAQLKTINKLSSDIIFPNQILETDKKQSSNASSSASEQNTNSRASNGAAKTSTYTVKKGDTLSAIAFKHNISLSNLMKWNNLNSTLIYPGNVFVVSKSSGSNSGSAVSSTGNANGGGSPASSKQPASAKVYTVKSGDTLSRIALQYSVTVANLKKWNNLSSDLILIGQKLKLQAGGTADSGKVAEDDGANNSGKIPADVSYNVNKLIQTAKSVKGVSYVWGGSTPSGFDCSGFIYYAYKAAGMNISRLSTDGYYNRSYYVNKPQPGDLVFFEGTYKAGISHMGIYLGNNQFIHASSDGVEISSLSNSYWKQHFDGYKRFY